MIVAQFADTTGWAGKAITYDDGQFAIEGVGFISPQDVLQYEQQGQITWAYDGVRDWVVQIVNMGAPGAVAPAAVALSPTPSTGAPGSYPAQSYAQPGYGQPGPAQPGYPQGTYAAAPTYAPQPRQPDPPTLAIVGFILSLAGFIFAFCWPVGLVLSWIGHSQAKRENLPTGLAMAGLIINAVMTTLGVLLFIFILIMVAVAGSSS